MSVIQRYEGENEGPHRIAELFARLVVVLSDYDGDFLGEACMTAEFGNRYAGQFFTPYCVSQLLARLTVSRESIEETLANGGPLRNVAEPASGAGSMVIALAQAIQQEGFDVSKTFFATLVDVDALCMQMGFLQVSCKGIPAVCVQGGTLRLEEYSFAYTMAGARACGLPIWDIHEFPPDGFEIKHPPLLTQAAAASADVKAAHPSPEPFEVQFKLL